MKTPNLNKLSCSSRLNQPESTYSLHLCLRMFRVVQRRLTKPPPSPASQGHLRWNMPPSLSPLPPLFFFLPFSLSLWVSPSGHPAHHNQMAKNAPQLVSLRPLCTAHDLLRGWESLHVCVNMCSLPAPGHLRHELSSSSHLMTPWHM